MVKIADHRNGASSILLSAFFGLFLKIFRTSASGLPKWNFRYSTVLHFVTYFKKYFIEKLLSNNGG